MNSTGARIAWSTLVALLTAGIIAATAVGLSQREADAEPAPPADPTVALDDVRDRVETLVPRLLSYTPDNVDTKLELADTVLTGRFRDEYRTLLEDTVIPNARAQGLTTDADVVGAGVESVTENAAKLVVFVDQRTTKRTDPTPQESKSTVLIGLRRTDGQWLIDAFDPV